MNSGFLLFIALYTITFIVSSSCFIVKNHIIGQNRKGTGLTNTYSLKLKIQLGESTDNLHKKANEIAESFGMMNLGQVDDLVGHYVFSSNRTSHLLLENDDVNSLSQKHISKNLSIGDSKLIHSDVEWFVQQEILRRSKRLPLPVKRDKPSEPSFLDPLYPSQWHLHNQHRKIDCNVTGVWANGITGKGVVVAIVDDGVQWEHPDLKNNYCPSGSFDLNSDDDDPTPEADEKEENKHGTRCAGEVAAVPNDVCGVGVAYEAKFSGIRVLDGPMTDSLEATAFIKRINVNDVYSCSWGPEDDGKTIDGPRALAQAALQRGVVAGRLGFGSIFVVASGNGGMVGDNCNYDGYASSIYTITIAAVDEFGHTPSYSEQCVSMLACTVSSGAAGARSITTTDWTLGREKDPCTSKHTGTSAATPLVAGMIALMLEARPCLTWRDVQHIIVMTATPVYKIVQDLDQHLWHTNAAGFSHSSNHGFGLLDSWKLVNAARTWENVPWLSSFEPTCLISNNKIPTDGKSSLQLQSSVSVQDCDRHLIKTLEQIVITISLAHPSRGRLKFEFICPSGTKSVVPTRTVDDSSDGLSSWSFSTVRCWGEEPHGVYILKIFDTKRTHGLQAGKLKEWKLRLYGSQMTPDEISQRKEQILDSLSGKYISPGSNYSVNCPVGQPTSFDVTTAISKHTLKLVVLISSSIFLLGVYYSFEMAFCNAEDKADNSSESTADPISSNVETQNTYSSTTLSDLTCENTSNSIDNNDVKSNENSELQDGIG